MPRILLNQASNWDGAAQTPGVSFSYWTGTEDRPMLPFLIPSGYPDVQTMLDLLPTTRMEYFAHRGGSIEYPEMSARAYTQAAAEGFGCLEWSTQRTSDGVFIGCHDINIDRVVAGGGSYPNVSAMTWAQIQQYLIKPPSAHPERSNEPFMRLEELIEMYGDTHILMIDPKNVAQGFYPDLLDLMDNARGPEGFIGKYAGSAPTWSSQLAARGYSKWGAYFDTDSQAHITETQGQWDILGFNYGASQEDWDFITSFGKPVYAHVCPDQGAVDQAVAKGAAGAQVSGTEAVNVYKQY
jgi:hypothetical protein